MKTWKSSLALLLAAALLLATAGCQSAPAPDSSAPTSEPLADGSYRLEAALSGGSGRAGVESPIEVTVKDGRATAVVIWSSPFYEFMIVDGNTYYPIQDEGNAAFEIPVVLDTDMPISAQTAAMSEPHIVDYTLRITAPVQGVPAYVWGAAIVVIVLIVTAAVISAGRKRRRA